MKYKSDFKKYCKSESDTYGGAWLPKELPLINFLGELDPFKKIIFLTKYFWVTEKRVEI